VENTTLSCISEMSNSDKNAKLLSNDGTYKRKKFYRRDTMFFCWQLHCQDPWNMNQINLVFKDLLGTAIT
jgi:hypothetical protein